ncbi:MAG: hypothetical protein QW261_04485 [Candidatus Jordarchaeaceae archaeon]
MSSEENLKNVKSKLKNVADTIRDFILQLGKLRQDLLDLSSSLEKITVTSGSEKEKMMVSKLPPTPIPEPPPISEPEPELKTSTPPETIETSATEAQVSDQEVSEEMITESFLSEAKATPTIVEETVETPKTETTEPEVTLEQLDLKTEELKPVSEIATSALPLNKVVSLLNELEQFCEGSLPAEEVAAKIESTRKSLQSLVLYHPIYYEMNQIAAKLRADSPKQPLSPTDKEMLLSKIPQWKRRMM